MFCRQSWSFKFAVWDTLSCALEGVKDPVELQVLESEKQWCHLNFEYTD